jgi:glycerophosphoryl diester phosphodiesterase
MSVAVSAHQGGRETAPSGTWAAYENALEIGADYIEFDVRRTRDGELVAFHDSRVGRGGPWVRDLTRSQLCARVGHEVPGVPELMRLMAGRAQGHVDIKEPGYETETVELACETFGEGAFVVTSEDVVVSSVKRDFPKVRCALAIGSGLFEGQASRMVQTRYSELYPRRRMLACGADSVAVQHRYAALTVLRMCEREQFDAMVWTVNDAARIRRFLRDDRVAVLVTDRPRHAMRVRRALAG